MNAYSQNIVITMIIMSLCLPSTLGLASAKSSSQLGSTWNHEDNPEEMAADRDMANLIGNYSLCAGYNDYNWFGASTTANNVYSAASGVGHDYSAAFYIGEGHYEDVWRYLWWERQWCIAAQDGSKIYDSDIYPHSGSQSVKFAFLWSCHSGDEIGGNHWPSGVPYGMPYAWFHTNDLSNDGYNSPDSKGRAFIGFGGGTHEHDGVAVCLTWDHWSENEGYLQHGGYTFLQSFYSVAFCYADFYSINAALDEAAWGVWGVPTFRYSIAYTGFNYTEWDYNLQRLVTRHSWMKVYGDGNMHLRKSLSLCAMKTKVNGQFYVPNLNIDTLKIDSLFSNPDIEGDQTGGDSIYFIADYPDGKVDVKDQYFVAQYFGEREVRGWNYRAYMADLYPDRIIDMRDFFRLCQNYGKSGSYSHDLSNVCVQFNTGQVVSPDADGYLSIPNGATSFTVYKGIYPTGATIIFWQTH